MQIKVENPNPPKLLMRELECKSLNYTSARYLYCCIWLGGESFCGVFGDGPNGAYEWFAWRSGQLETSDAGFGSLEVPLRIVLNKVAEDEEIGGRDESMRLLRAAWHTLRSYEYGNAATDPAKDMAASIDLFLKTGAPQTLVGKASR